MKNPIYIKYLKNKAVLSLVALVTQPVLAATYTWDGGGADNNISTAENWVGDAAPQNSADGFIFAGNTRTTVNNDFGYGSVMQFDFDASAGAFVFQGNGISSYGGINNASSSLQTFSNSQLAVFQSQTWDAGSGGLHILVPEVVLLNDPADVALTITGSGDTLISADIVEAFPSATGLGALVKEGAGTLTLSGNNSYGGGTTVNAGTLQGNTVSLKGAIANNAFVVFDQAQAGSFAGTLSGAGTIEKQGSGALIFSGAHTFTGITNINAGHLIVNGTLPGTINVNNGALLRGKGALGNVTVNSGGTLSPGYSRGNLSMESLTLNAGSTTLMEIDGLSSGTQYDQITVTNTAILNGTLNLDFGFTPVAGNTFSLVTANSLVLDGNAQTGFSTITDNISSNLGAALKVTPVVDGNSFDIVIEQGDFALVAGKLTDNQAAVADSLDSFSTSGSAADVFARLNLLTADELPEVLDSLSGVQHVHIQTISRQQGENLRSLLGQRLNQHHGLLAGASGGDLAEGSLHGWVNVLGGAGEIDDTDDASGSDYSTAGVSGGADVALGHNTILGGAFAYANAEADVADGDMSVDSYQLAVYGRWQYGFGYLNGQMELGYHDADTHREVFSGIIAEAQYHASTAGVTVEAGHQFMLNNNGMISPFVALEYAAFTREEFTEENAGGASLYADSEKEDSLRSHIGFRWQQLFALEDGTQVGPKIGLAWVHEYLDDEPGLDAGFAAAPGSSFLVEGAQLDSDRARVEAGLSAQLDEYSNFWFGYVGELAGSDNHHALSATYAISF